MLQVYYHLLLLKLYFSSVRGKDNAETFDAPISYFSNPSYPKTDWMPNYSSFTIRVSILGDMIRRDKNAFIFCWLGFRSRCVPITLGFCRIPSFRTIFDNESIWPLSSWSNGHFFVQNSKFGIVGWKPPLWRHERTA